MKSIVVGTAGHIDHGKTALVKALTGIDADRLAEEKRRGITIDLGFAHLELSGAGGEALRFGFVDVPGHERFVRNMLAGAGGIDAVVLVVAADEGIKPQTREHFDICRLLGTQRGLTVLTKCDLVDSETLAVLRLEIEDFLGGSFLEGAPIVPVSALDGRGLELVKRELVAIAGRLSPRDRTAITRLPIDRVFTIKGFGTVVTGTLIQGTIRKDDELDLLPGLSRARVRGIQVHGESTEEARAGERTALNLSGAAKDDLKRGMVLAAPGLLRTSLRLDARLSLLGSVKPLRNGARVHLHAFTSESIATVRYFDRDQLEGGQQALAHLRLSLPLLLLPGDRFILRQLSPAQTVGGGVVVDSFPALKMPAQARMEFLTALEAGEPMQVLLERVRRSAEHGSSLARLTAETGQSQEALRNRLAELESRGRLTRRGDLLVEQEVVRSLSQKLLGVVREFQAQNPLAPGMGKEALREKARLSPEALDAVLGFSTHEKLLAITGDVVHLPGRGVVMKGEEAESRDLIEQAFRSAGLKVPALRDVLAGLRIDRLRAEKIVTLLLREKVLIKVSDELVFHHSALSQLRSSLLQRKLRSARIDVAGFKDLAGVSRKYAIPLLEYLDRERVTRREGDQRIIL